ncbi:MAG: InlB B-repeat-containing protein [Clostridia bacterium]|nr:InlB B-repeat-containing protein [Clostridia bacterium]
MREERRKLLPLALVAAIALLAVLSLIFGSLCYGGFSDSSDALVISITDGTASPSFNCESITYSGDYASAPSIAYKSIVFNEQEVINVPAGLDIKLDEGGYVVYRVYDESGSLLGDISTADNEKLVVSSQSILDHSGVLELNVEFEYQTYTVEYVLNADSGASVTNPNPTSFKFDTSPTLNAPVWAGYEFVGWFTVDGTEEQEVTAFTASIFDKDRHVTLHAKWRALSFTLSLYKEDGTTLMAQYSVQVGESLAAHLPVSPDVDAGRRFIGWYTSSGVRLADNAVMSASDLSLYVRTEEIVPKATIIFSFEYESGDTSVEHKRPIDTSIDLSGGDTFTVEQLLSRISVAVDGHDYAVFSSSGDALELSDTITFTDGENKELTVSYTRRSFTVTINYLYSYDRSVAATAKETVLKYGDSADIASPAIDAFAPSRLAVSVSKIKANQSFTVTYVTTENSKTLTLPDGSVIIVTNDDGGLVGAELTVTGGGDKGVLKEMTSKLKAQGMLAEAGAQYGISLSKGKFGYRGTYTVKIRLQSSAAKMINPTLFRDKEGTLVHYDADFGDASIVFKLSADDIKAGEVSVVFAGMKPTSIGVYIGIGIAAAVVVIGIILLILWLVLWTKKKVKFEVGGGEAIDTVVVKRGSVITVPTPYKEGAEFMGWYKDKAYKKPVEYLSEDVVKAEIDDTPYADKNKADDNASVGGSADGNVAYEQEQTAQGGALATDAGDNNKKAADNQPMSQAAMDAFDENAVANGMQIKVRGSMTLYAKWLGPESESAAAADGVETDAKGEGDAAAADGAQSDTPDNGAEGNA